MTKAEKIGSLTSRNKDAKKEEERRVNEHTVLKEKFCEVFATAEGLEVLKWLKDQCGWDKADTAVNPQSLEITNLTVHNAALRGLYSKVRKMIRPSILKKIEYINH